jgi:glycine/D-amino acid oxidase-like deaminating enzyme
MSTRVRCDLPRNRLSRVDVVVIGGGISGQTTAAAAALRGAKVAVVEKERQPAVEGSGRAQGSVRLQGRAAVELPLAREAIELWTHVDRKTEIELSFGGNIYLCDDPDELPLLRSLVQTAHQSGLRDVELLDPDQARTMLPGADGPFVAAMWSPHDGRCDPGKATRYFADLATARGVEHHYGVRARRVLERGGRVLGVATEQGVIEADAVVIAGGIWTPHLARTIGVKIPLMPVIVSQCETTPSRLRFDPTIRAFACGCRQRPDGRIVLSAGLNTIVEHHLTLADLVDVPLWLSRLRHNHRNVRLRLDFHRSLAQLRRRAVFATDLIPVGVEPPPPDLPAMRQALGALHSLLPGTRDTRIARCWSGMVDMSPDGLPIIDGHAGADGVVIVTGLSGHGLALGPVIGEISADLALDRQTSRPVHPFRLARFQEGRVPTPEKMI